MKRAAQSGLTLAEVIIAMAILSVIVALTYGTFATQHATRERVTELGERDQELRGALLRMTREISMAFVSNHFDAKRFRERPTFFTGKDFGKDDSLLFTSVAHQRLYLGAKESDQAVFEYKLDRDPDDNSVRSLFRRVKPIIDEDPDREGTKQVLATAIDGLDFEYWDAEKNEWKREWDTTSRDQADKLPIRVRITIHVKDPSGKEDLRYTTQAALAMPAPLNF